MIETRTDAEWLAFLEQGAGSPRCAAEWQDLLAQIIADTRVANTGCAPNEGRPHSGEAALAASFVDALISWSIA